MSSSQNQDQIDRVVDIFVYALQDYQQRNSLKTWTTVSLNLEVKYSHDEGASYSITFRQGYEGAVESVDLASVIAEAQRRFAYDEQTRIQKQAFTQARLAPPTTGFDDTSDNEESNQ